MIGNRTTKQIFLSFFLRRHYTALIGMKKVYPRFLKTLWQYLTASGKYPSSISVRTPLGTISIQLYSHHDLLTVNEIFCRNDYFANNSIRQVVDLGSNIGISALYFLTRNKESKCILYEPNPVNIERLKLNLRGFESRYNLVQLAVSDEEGRLEFGVEPTGRYGGIGLKTAESIIVECVHINQVLKNVLADVGHIDILKIDTEGVEVRTVQAIEPKFLDSISTIYLEASPPPPEYLHPAVFKNTQYGTIRQLTKSESRPGR